MRKIILLFVVGLVGLCLTGQAFADVRHMPQARGMAPKRLPVPHNEWDFMRVYHQLVLLVEYSDVYFSMPDPQVYYNRLLNEPGFNYSVGPGCAAEYMLDQSKGLFHVQFDVFGPLRLDLPAKHYTGKNYGIKEKSNALDSLFAAFPDMDYSIYDWNNDSIIDQILYICSGLGAEAGGYSGAVWANTTGALYLKTTPDGLGIDQHSISSENPSPDAPGGWYGFGTLIHEYSHALGLPDVYPTGGNNAIKLYSVVDTWDLMDGGNYTNYGWCPSNMAAHERMYLNWLTPVELKSDTVITGLKPVADGGEAYIIKHTEKEYLLLENRQQTGWDYGIPGQGLTIWHINFDPARWQRNDLNSESLRVSMYYADNMNYQEWMSHYKANKSLYGTSCYSMEYMLRSCLLSSAAYPWSTDSTQWVNDELTAESVPALGTMYNANRYGSKSLDIRITNIRQASDGTVSFVFENTSPYADVSNLKRDDVPCTKVLRDGMLLIERNGRTYTLTGLELR